MALQQADLQEQSQRFIFEMEPHGTTKRLKIRVENHDAGLGWYTAGSLSLPLHQLPLLEQAIEDMRRQELADDDSGKIIPFPALPQDG